VVVLDLQNARPALRAISNVAIRAAIDSLMASGRHVLSRSEQGFSARSSAFSALSGRQRGRFVRLGRVRRNARQSELKRKREDRVQANA
jgi:hypothetical protein